MTVGREAYRLAGVDVEAGDRAVELIRQHLVGQRVPGVEVVGGVGGFGAAVALPRGYRDPLLVSGTDGVGTKTALAATLGRYDTVGVDVVAYNADDVVCHGARPLFFLDYLAVGRVDPATVAALVAGVARGCELAGCALVGGETAEHPGLLAPGQFDLAGTCVGIVERADYLDGSRAAEGDRIVGIASSGLHASGFSLVRRLLADHELDLGRPYLDVLRATLGPIEADRAAAEEPASAGATLGQVLLAPSRVYALDLLALREALRRAGHELHGLAHVTGGGLPGNVPRSVGSGLGVRVDPAAWPTASVFRLVAALGRLDGPELRATFNAGIGMTAVVPEAAIELSTSFLAERGLAAWPIGRVVSAAAAGPARYVEGVGAAR